MTLKAMTIVVTGAYGNLGRAVAAKLGAEGTNLVLIGRRADALDEAFPGEAKTRRKVAVDLLDERATIAAFRAAAKHFGGLDGLCAIAGGFNMGPAVHETSAKFWQEMADSNVTTLLNSAKACVPHILKRGGGAVVTVGANGALRGSAKMAAYCAAKSSVMRITESMAAELGPSGIRVNCVLPGTIDTPQNRKAMPKADPGKWVGPEDIAQTIAFLLSPSAKAINGALVPVLGHS